MTNIVVQPEVIKGLADCIVDIIQNKIDWGSVDWQAVAEKAAERSKGEWIPVSERLPEDMQDVLIWFEYYRYGDFNYMHQTYGFGYVCDGKWSPIINGETGWKAYNVIAWQHLPEPYKEGGAEE